MLQQQHRWAEDAAETGIIGAVVGEDLGAVARIRIINSSKGKAIPKVRMKRGIVTVAFCFIYFILFYFW